MGAKSDNSSTVFLREMMQRYPLTSRHDPPAFSPNIMPGINTGILRVEGLVVYASQTTAAWLWNELPSGTFWHVLDDRGHHTAFLASDLGDVVRRMQARGRQVLIV